MVEKSKASKFKHKAEDKRINFKMRIINKPYTKHHKTKLKKIKKENQRKHINEEN